jgi:DNA-binding transcriptional LysR family regulator
MTNINGLNNLDLNLLRVLDALLRHKHVGKAATALGLSQPAISYALKKLRAHYQDPLFVKTRSGVQPTAAAERLGPHVTHILEQVREHLGPAPQFSPETSNRTFTLSLSDLGEMIVLPKLLRALARSAPNVNLRMFSGGPSDLSAALQSGELDLMIGYFPDQQGLDFFQQGLYSHGFVCVARHGHPAVGKPMDREAFLSLQHASIRSKGHSQQVVESAFEKQGIHRRKVLETGHFLSIPFVVAATNLVVTVPKAVGELFSELARLQTFEPPIQLPRLAIRQYWHRRQTAEPGNKWLRALVRKLFHGPDGWRLDR